MKQNLRDTMRFVIPTSIENTLTIFIGMVLSTLIGGVSNSALAAASTPNMMMNVYNAVFSIVISGGPVLTSRLIGAGDSQEASRTMEQAIWLTVVASTALGALSMVLARPMMDLMMSTAEEQLLAESAVYMRMLALSFPFLTLNSVLANLLRASGDASTPMTASFIVNAMLVGCMFLFMKFIDLKMTGAGLAYVVSRLVGSVFLMVVCLRDHRSFRLSVGGMLRPNGTILKRIARIGLPTSFESMFVQGGYLVANLMVIRLDTWQATVYNISNSLSGFAALPSSVCSAIGTTFVGHRLGAQDKKGARRVALTILGWGFAISMFLSVTVALFGKPLSMLYTSDDTAAAEAGRIMWIWMAYNVCSISINTIDPILRVGGDVKFVMWQTSACVWLLRLPLSYLMAFTLGMGVPGILWANIISLTARMAFGLWRFFQGKWMNMKV